MTFADVAVGARFWFRHEKGSDYDWGWFVKTGPRTYERRWSDGSYASGRVEPETASAKCRIAATADPAHRQP